MQICTTCVLPATFPKISFDADGRCSFCVHQNHNTKQELFKQRYRSKFMDLLREKKNNRPYDAIMAYSGGKDSTYTLKLLKETFDLSILAITFDHGFVSPMASTNMKQVATYLDVDLITVTPKPKTMQELFQKSMAPDIYPMKSLERASSICNSCMNLVKSYLLKVAIEMEIPIIAYGWSPGQAPVQSSVLRMNRAMLQQMQKAAKKPIEKMIGDRLSSFFPETQHRQNTCDAIFERYPYLVHPLAFSKYDENQILAEIKEIGWENPKDTDSNSSNCLLNGFANEVHLHQHGFHPYAFEIAGLVRGGYMARAEGLKRLSAKTDARVVEYVKKQLDLAEEPQELPSRPL